MNSPKFNYKQLQELYDIGLTCQEVASIIGCSVNTVRRNITTRINYRRTGSDHPGWKGGIKWSDGYCYIKKIGDHNNYYKRANLVLEEKLGRPLATNEIAHHINRNRSDDSPDNLEVKLRGPHMADHNKERAANGSYKGAHKNQLRNNEGKFI